MIDKIKACIDDISSFESISSEEIELFRIKYLGKKGIINKLFSEFKTIDNSQKKEVGQLLNQLKNAANQKMADLILDISDGSNQSKSINDITRPGDPIAIGSRHPISLVKNRIINIFSKIGFTISEGPEIEDDWHNFTALNLPEYHPARDMQDTFYLKDGNVLRTHTSTSQIHFILNNKPPIRIIAPGRVYRNEDVSVRSYCLIHQIEVLYVDKILTF